MHRRTSCNDVKFKGLDIYIPPLRGPGDQNSSSLQWEVAYWPAMTQVAQRKSRQPIARMNGLWTPQSAGITDPHYAQPAALWPSPRNLLRQRLTIFSSEYCQPDTSCYSFNYPGGMKGWVGLSTVSVNNLLKVIARKRSWWESNPRPLSPLIRNVISGNMSAGFNDSDNIIYKEYTQKTRKLESFREIYGVWRWIYTVFQKNRLLFISPLIMNRFLKFMHC